MKNKRLWIALFLLFFLCVTESVFANTSKVVRVGVIDFGDFIYWNEQQQQYDGYGVGYLNEISNHCNWEIEYVCGTWEECVAMLRNGEIDFLCPAQKTLAREQEFLFPKYSAGRAETAVYARKGSEQLFYGDADFLMDKDIGVIEGSAQQIAFNNYAIKHGIKYNEIVYESGTKLFEALDKGEIDIFVASSLYSSTDYCVIDRFDVAPFYFMFSPESEQLLNEFDDAVEKLKLNNYNFDSNLFDLYYNNPQSDSDFMLTREEYEYIKESPEITIGFYDGFFPYTDNVDGKMVGICERMTEEIARKTGLNIKMVSVPCNVNPKDVLLADNGIDIMGGIIRSKEYLEDSDLQISDAVFDYEFLAVVAKDTTLSSLNGKTVALPENVSYKADGFEDNYDDLNVLILPDVESCMEAVKRGNADLSILNKYVCTYLLQMPKYDKLKVSRIVRFEESNAFVANKNVDGHLMSILNRAINSMSKDVKNNIIDQYTINNTYNPTVIEYVYIHRHTFILIASIVVVMLIIIAIVYKNMMRVLFEKKQIEASQKEIERSSLTGLYNKHAFYQKAENLIKDNQEVDYSIIIFDFVKFKIINDLFGTTAGDGLLKYFANKLEELVGPHGVAGYRGADNFVICIDSMYVRDIEKLDRELQKFVNEYPIDIKIEICMGIYQVIDRNVAVSLMCDRANMAAESVKGNELLHYAFYDDSMRQKLLQDQEILNEMQNALDHGEFKVFIQPKCRVDSEELVGGESLVRWEHPTKGMISPGVFIPLFENNGFITKLDYYVWEKTCQLIRGWKDAGLKTVPLSVNVSRLNFYLPDFADTFELLLKKYGLNHDDLYLEVTESAYTTESDVIFNQLTMLQDKNFTILMDDFGSGYSSLNMLQEAPVDVLKLDMKFLLGNDEKKRSEVIIEAVIDMAHKLGFRVIAEGVETKEQCDILKRLGCQLAQGYYFSKPISSEDFEEKYLRNGNVQEKDN